MNLKVLKYEDISIGCALSFAQFGFGFECDGDSKMISLEVENG